MDNEKWFVDGCKKLPQKSPVEILNWYRNLYYQEPPTTEHGIMARAINDCTMLLSGNTQTVAHWRFVDGECTNCGWFGDCVDTPYYTFCPNCGAKMDVEGSKMDEETGKNLRELGYTSYDMLIDAGIEALNELKKRNNGCPFCIPDRDGYSVTHGAYSLNGDELCTGHCKPRKIKFCPLCGRQITKGGA